jgi:hypothetical protein
MQTDNADIEGLIKRLSEILSILDDKGHPIAAIKIEEAINSLQQPLNTDETPGDT